MKDLNKYLINLNVFVKSYPKQLPVNVEGIDSNTASWEDPVWYIKDIQTGVPHRYIFLKAVKGITRIAKDSAIRKPADIESEMLCQPYGYLLKIYALEVQLSSIVNNSKQLRVTKAAQILTKAEELGGINNIPLAFWNGINGSNIFWDFCARHRLLSGAQRPIHTDRERGADATFTRSQKHLKMTSESMIYALGDIFTKVFHDVDKDGNLNSEGGINIPDALTITAALLGLASPNRLNGEIPLLANQQLKVIQPKNGNEVYYLDWPGSKGYQDNQNHILKALVPQVKKAINFFYKYLAPERHFIRYLKNMNQTWESIMNGFVVEKERMENLDFHLPPNLFTVAYALGFYPVTYEIEILNSRDGICPNNSVKGWSWGLPRYCSKRKRRLKRADMVTRKSIGRVCPDDLVLNLTGQSGKTPYSIQKLLMCDIFNKSFSERLNLPLIATVKDVQESVVRIIKEIIPTFPLSHTDSETGLDLESALFCISPGKHNFGSSKGMAGSPLSIFSLSKIKTYFVTRLNPSKKQQNCNLFYKYGFGYQKLRLHSLRHFANTQAEKGGIPINVIATWSGRKTINQTLEYIHTSDKEKADRLVATLDLNDAKKDIRVITTEELQTKHILPASLTETGVCAQELAVTPCNYINDFLSGCLGCESACYVSGDESAINVLEHDLRFQLVRLNRLRQSKESFVSQANKNWWVKHSQGVSLLEQLIVILKEHRPGQLVSVSSDRRYFFITDLDTKHVEEKRLTLPAEKELLKAFEVYSEDVESIPDSMKSLVIKFGLEN